MKIKILSISNTKDGTKMEFIPPYEYCEEMPTFDERSLCLYCFGDLEDQSTQESWITIPLESCIKLFNKEN